MPVYHVNSQISLPTIILFYINITTPSLEINIDVGNVPTLTNACGSTEFLDGESKEKKSFILQYNVHLQSPLALMEVVWLVPRIQIGTFATRTICLKYSSWSNSLTPLESARHLAEGGFLGSDWTRQGALLYFMCLLVSLSISSL